MRLPRYVLLCAVTAVATLGLWAQTASPTGASHGILITGYGKRAESGPMMAMEAASATASSRRSFVRYGSETRYFEDITDKAYFRDAFVGGDTTLIPTHDGETWYAEAMPPGATTWRTWTPIVYHESLPDGRTHCFVDFTTTLCDADYLDVIWFTGGQCSVGKWQVRFHDDGATFGEGEFNVVPELPPGWVDIDNQGLYSQQYGNLCARTVLDASGKPVIGPNGKMAVEWKDCIGVTYERPAQIREKGCTLTSAKEMLSYHFKSARMAAPTTLQLNDWLKDPKNNGITDGFVDPWAVARFARSKGVSVRYVGPGTAATLRTNVCSYGPQLVQARVGTDTLPSHWATATGFTDKDFSDIWLADPNGGKVSLISDYGGSATKAATRLFSGPEYSLTTLSGLYILFHSPVQFVVTNPVGRRTGFDVATGQYLAEIPSASYDNTGIGDITGETYDADPFKVLEVNTPAAGDYRVDITGTGDGTYNMDINAYDDNDGVSPFRVQNVPISKGEQQSFTFTYSPTPGSAVELKGGFDGGGQRPRDVNKFLTYAKPGTDHVSLPAGTASYNLVVFFGKSTIPGSFKAVLNGSDITGAFTPVPGSSQAVVLPLQLGSNVLKLSIDGTVGSRTATDSDRLVFNVQ